MKNKNVEKVLEDYVDEVKNIYRENDIINVENKKDILKTKYNQSFNEIIDLLEFYLGSQSNSILSEIEGMLMESRIILEKHIENLEVERFDGNGINILSKKIEELYNELDSLPDDLETKLDAIEKNMNVSNDMLCDYRNYENKEIYSKECYTVQDSILTELKTEVKRALYRRNIEDDEIDYEINRILDSNLVQDVLDEFEESDRVNEENIIESSKMLMENVKFTCMSELQKEIEEKSEETQIESENALNSNLLDELKEEVNTTEEIIEEAEKREKNEEDKDKDIQKALDPNLIV